ncbi:Transglutaminase-activating metalloprotease [Streptomyces tendae]
MKGNELVKLSPSQRAELIRDANATKAETADDLGLGAKEKLVVRDVLKDRDGTLHTRYERTYDGLPVLGGDLVVASEAGKTEQVVKATAKAIKPATVTPKISAAKGRVAGRVGREGRRRRAGRTPTAPRAR